MVEIAKRDLPLDVGVIDRIKAIIRQNRVAKMSFSSSVDTGRNLTAGTLSNRRPETSTLKSTVGSQPAQPQPQQEQAETMTKVRLDPCRVFDDYVELTARIQYNPTTFAVMAILVITAAGLTAKGWEASPHEAGTTQDADFWFLLQSSLMQIAGMVLVLFSLARDPNMRLQSRLWSWWFL